MRVIVSASPVGTPLDADHVVDDHHLDQGFGAGVAVPGDDVTLRVGTLRCREALLLFTLVEGFSFSSALFSAPLREADVRAVVTATTHRLRDAYPPFEETG
jgi:hypothetical protein